MEREEGSFWWVRWVDEDWQPAQFIGAGKWAAVGGLFRTYPEDAIEEIGPRIEPPSPATIEGEVRG